MVHPGVSSFGCTIQGKAFTAGKSQFDAAGIKIVGISDDASSHKNFCTKFSFTIDLLADTNSALMKTLDSANPSGRGSLGAHHLPDRSQGRDPEGLRRGYPEGHEQVLLNDIKGLKAA